MGYRPDKNTQLLHDNSKLTENYINHKIWFKKGISAIVNIDSAIAALLDQLLQVVIVKNDSCMRVRMEFDILNIQVTLFSFFGYENYVQSPCIRSNLVQQTTNNS